MKRLAAFALATSGCILFVSPETGGDHCKLHGSETTCGQCLTTRCTAEIDAACFDDAILASVEDCAAGTDACNHLAPSPLATCLKSKCAPLCFARTGKSITHCNESFVSTGLACSCDTDGPANDFACDPSVYPRTRCCAPNGWPGPALECTCNAISCTPLADGCVCTLTDNLDPATAQECTGRFCCAFEDLCKCGPRACSGAERRVDACNKAEVHCPHEQTEFPACSIRR